jgi:hypothetical protein
MIKLSIIKIKFEIFIIGKKIHLTFLLARDQNYRVWKNPFTLFLPASLASSHLPLPGGLCSHNFLLLIQGHLLFKLVQRDLTDRQRWSQWVQKHCRQEAAQWVEAPPPPRVRNLRRVLIMMLPPPSTTHIRTIGTATVMHHLNNNNRVLGNRLTLKQLNTCLK